MALASCVCLCNFTGDICKGHKSSTYQLLDLSTIKLHTRILSHYHKKPDVAICSQIIKAFISLSFSYYILLKSDFSVNAISISDIALMDTAFSEDYICNPRHRNMHHLFRFVTTPTQRQHNYTYCLVHSCST